MPGGSVIVDFVAATHSIGLRRKGRDGQPVFTSIQMIQILLFSSCPALCSPVPGIRGIGTDCAPVSRMAGTSQDEPGHDE